MLFAENPNLFTLTTIWSGGHDVGLFAKARAGALGSSLEDGRGEHKVAFRSDILTNRRGSEVLSELAQCLIIYLAASGETGFGTLTSDPSIASRAVYSRNGSQESQHLANLNPILVTFDQVS
jgi:hypothetical protein